MNPRDVPNVAGGLPFVWMAPAVAFAVMALLLVWSSSRRREYLPVEKEIIIIIVTSVESVPAPYPHYQP
jgi:heme exporter protein CcmD